MDPKNVKECLMHSFVEKVPVLNNTTRNFYISSKEDIEKEVGKGDPNWFVTRSHQCSKAVPLSSIQKTPVTKSQLHDLSPVGSLSKLLDSQFSETSPLTGWIAPSLGRSPVAGTAKEYFDSQYGLIKSLGVNDSTLSWTSSLATPNHGLVCHDEDNTEDHEKKKGFSRKLFSPDGRTGGVHKFPQLNESPQIKTEKLPFNDDHNSFVKREVKSEDMNELFGIADEAIRPVDVKVEHVDTLEDALSDFFDPPSKAAGRRRSAPTFRRNDPVSRRKRSRSQSQDNQSQCHTSQEVLGVKELSAELSVNDASDVPIKCIKSIENLSAVGHSHDLNSKAIDIGLTSNQESLDNDEGIMSEKSKQQDTSIVSDLPTEDGFVKHPEEQNDLDLVKSCKNYRECSLMCSTPIDIDKTTFKSILSTTKKKTPSSKKQVRFEVEPAPRIDKEKESDKLTDFGENVENNERKGSPVLQKTPIRILKNEMEKSSNINDHVNSVKTEKEEGNEQDDMFSQVSPSALQEMCSMSIEKSSTTEQELLPLGHVTKTGENKTVDNHMRTQEDMSNTVTGCKTAVPQNDGEIVDKNGVGKELKKPLKRKMFCYPTSSQINISCPKSVYGFKGEPVTEEVKLGEIHRTPDTQQTADNTRTVTTNATVSTSHVTPNSSTSASKQGSGTTGFKKYSDMIACQVNDQKLSPAPASLHQHSVNVDMYSTPKSRRRDSTDLQRRRLVAVSDKTISEHIPKTSMTPKPIPENIPKTSVTLKPISGQVSKTFSETPKSLPEDIPNTSSLTSKSIPRHIPETSVTTMEDNTLLQDFEADMFNDDLPDDSFSKEISIDSTLDKLSDKSVLKTSCSNPDVKMSPLPDKDGQDEKNVSLSREALSENFKKQYQLSVSPENEKPVPFHKSECESDQINEEKMNCRTIAMDVLTENFSKQFRVINENESKQELNACQGFQTASGKKLEITQDKISKAKTLMDVQNIDNTINFVDDFVISHEDSEKQQTVKHSVPKQKCQTEILDLEIKTSDRNDNKMAKVTLDDADWSNEQSAGFTCRNLSVCSSNNDKPSDGQQNTTHDSTSKFQHDPNITDDNKVVKSFKSSEEKILPSNQLFQGFTSASGKKLDLSSACLAKAQKLINEVLTEESFDNFETNKNISSETTASGKRSHVKESSIDKGCKVMVDEKIKMEHLSNGQNSHKIGKDSSFNGFSTASGKGLKLSESSIFKAETLMKKLDSCDTSKENISPLAGFSSASGKALHLSELSLQKACKLMDTVTAGPDHNDQHDLIADNGCGGLDSQTDTQVMVTEQTTSSLLHNAGFGGFTTASGKDLNLSESSLRKAQHLMIESDDQNSIKLDRHCLDSNEGLTTESSKTNVDNVLQELTVPNMNEKKVYFGGFSTASGKGLFLTESSISKAKNILKGASSEESTSTCLESVANELSSASGKDLPITSRSILKASKLLHEKHDNIDRSASAKSKKDLFEDIFNSLLSDDIDLTTSKSVSNENELVKKCDTSVDRSTKMTESNNLLGKSKIHGTTKQSSRFPPGAVVPKGFRPFKPPKIISKPKDSCDDKKNEETKQLDLGGGSHKTEVLPDFEVGIKETVEDSLEGTCLNDVFSDMMSSQMFSPESGRPLKKIRRNSDEPDIATETGILEKVVDRDNSNMLLKKSSVVGKEGDGQGGEFLSVDPEIDFKGDNSQFSLEMFMDPSNEFTQVMMDDDKLTGEVNQNNGNYLDKEKNKKSTNIPMNELFQSASWKSCSVSENALYHVRQTLNSSGHSPDSSLAHLDCTNPFKSAAGKVISVSEHALIHAKKAFDDDHVDGSLGLNMDSLPKQATEQLSLQEVPELKSDFESDHSHTTKTSLNPFESALGKSIVVSEKALKSARKTLHDEEKNNILTFKDSEFDFEENSFDLTNNCLVENIKTSTKFSKPKSNVGCANPFQSASGKSIIISDNALQQARNKLNDSDYSSDLTQSNNPSSLHTPHPHDDTSGYSSSVDINNISTKHEHVTWEPINDSLLKNPFQSASGKVISVSEGALKQARVTLCEDGAGPSASTLVSPSGKGHQVPDVISEETSATNQKQGDSFSSHAVSELCCTRTENSNPFLSGKHVAVSEEALMHARDNFNEDTLLAQEERKENSFGNKKVTSVNLSNPFQSASGKSIKISEKSLQQAKQKLDEDSASHGFNEGKIEEKFSSSNSAMSLFQSAAGKPVNISDSNLQKARDMLNKDVSTSSSTQSIASNTTSPSEPLNKVNVNESSGTKQKSVDSNMTSHSKPLPTVNGNEITVTKRKRSEFEDDFDIPFEILEQMEKHGKKLKIEESTGGKKPLSTIPEDFSRDRIGFSAKPFTSTSNYTKRAQDVPAPKPPVAAKSTFHTPYKSSTAEPVTATNEGKVKHVAPVFIPKGTPALHQRDPNIQKSQTRDKVQQCSDVPLTVKTPAIQKSSTNSISNQNVNNKVLVKVSPNQTEQFVITDEIVKVIRSARQLQERRIREKVKRKVQPVEGRLYQMKQGQGRLKIKDVLSRCSSDQASIVHVQPTTKQVRSGNAGQHRFYLPYFYGKNIHNIIVGDGALLVPDDKGYVGRQEFYQAFLTLDGIDGKLVDEKWFNNHYRWVVWKLAAYEVGCPQMFAGRCLTPEVVMLQMKYRYDREIDKCQRSAIMKICERDDASTKRMVLCVCAIEKSSSLKEPKVMLTDGWYSINAQIDSPLTSLINKGHVKVGQKLCVSGADIVGSQNACPPLEAPESLMLKLCSNSTRPAPWDARLGYQTDHTPLCIPLSSVHGEGGLIGCVDVVIVRKYPTMYMEKLPAGGCIFRTHAAEERFKQTFQQLKHEKMEKLYVQMEKELEKNAPEKKNLKMKNWTSNEIQELSTGEEIYEAINTAKHPEDVQMNLSTVQLELLMEYQRSLQEEKRQNMNSKFQKAWSEDEQNVKDRNVVPLMKLRVVGCCRKDCDNQSSSLLTIWRPSPGHHDLKEGKRYKIYSLASSSQRPGSCGVPLTATKQSQFKPLHLDDNIMDMIYEPREASTKQDIIEKRPPYKEVDLVGIVVSINHSTTDNSGKQIDMVYISDINDGLIGVKFWGGLKHVGLSDTVKEGVVCCYSNLCDRSTYPSVSLPVVEYTSDLSVVSQTPQYSAQRKHLEKLKVKLKNKEFLLTVKERLEDKLNRKAELGHGYKHPESFQTTDLSSSIENIAEAGGKTPTPKVASKMAALMSYSSPAPLSPLVLSSSKSIHRAFKSPMLTRK